MFNFLLITFIPNSPTLFLSKVRQTNPGSVCTSLLDNVTILQLIFAILVEYPTFFPTYRIQFDYYVTDLAPIYLKIPSYSFLIVYEDVRGRLGALNCISILTYGILKLLKFWVDEFILVLGRDMYLHSASVLLKQQHVQELKLLPFQTFITFIAHLNNREVGVGAYKIHLPLLCYLAHIRSNLNIGSINTTNIDKIKLHRALKETPHFPQQIKGKFMPY